MNKNYFVVGDLHGQFHPIRELMMRKPQLRETENVMICLGDFGANYYLTDRDRGFKRKLEKYPFTYFVIRGNHEDRPSKLAKVNPNKWHVEEFEGGMVWVENDFPHIKYATDFVSYYNIGGYQTLVIPGAYSVDKFWRIQRGMQWFEDEQLTQEEMSLGKVMIKAHKNKADLVLSHTCPIGWMPTDLFLSQIDQNTVDNTMERYLGEIEYTLDYKAWLWGHYHAFRDYPRTDGRFRTMLAAYSILDLNKYMAGEINKL